METDSSGGMLSQTVFPMHKSKRSEEPAISLSQDVCRADRLFERSAIAISRSEVKCCSMQPFLNLLEALQSLGGEEGDSYAAEFALSRVERCQEKCLLKLLLEVVLWCCNTTEGDDVHHRFRQHLVQHIQRLLQNHHTTQCVLYEEVPTTRHQASPRASECLCSRLYRYHEVYYGILGVQGGDLIILEADRCEFSNWIVTLFEKWINTHLACKDFKEQLAQDEP